jgi:hypothetical protein
MNFCDYRRRRCYNAVKNMADWKQITARIRRARGSRDPAGQLSLLFEKTKDAMVAFELGRHFEVARDPAQAVHWYQTAFSRFRRGDWKTKSGDAIVRLGGELPAETQAQGTAEVSLERETAETAPPPPPPVLPFEPSPSESLVAVGSESPPDEAPVMPASGDKRHRRRGRRGGRNRNKRTAAPASPARSRHEAHSATAAEPPELAAPRVVDSRAIPRLPVEAVTDSAAPGVRGRSGDPGLSSRLSLLEMQLRRLLTCPPSKLGHADHAPAGPGVFVLTDDDMTTYYYVEACDTLRIAVGSLTRAGSARRGHSDLKPQLADHLGIPEARVPKYLADHCVVRWLQLDEGATPFAHFAIAVLRPILNQ